MSINDIVYMPGNSAESLRSLLHGLSTPFVAGESIGIKVHWGERGNNDFLPPYYTREIIHWLQDSGAKPFVFDTTVLYSGGRRNGKDSLKNTASRKTISAVPS
jgi:uncharacterized Fe-S center protein